jgi:hypothetical protein
LLTYVCAFIIFLRQEIYRQQPTSLLICIYYHTVPACQWVFGCPIELRFLPHKLQQQEEEEEEEYLISKSCFIAVAKSDTGFLMIENRKKFFTLLQYLDLFLGLRNSLLVASLLLHLSQRMVLRWWPSYLKRAYL